MSINYIQQNVTLTFAVATTFDPGDYARMFWNDGSGAIDWVTPPDDQIYFLYGEDSGYFGWGHQTWGHFRWGHAQARNVSGWGHLPWGHFPWGFGAGIKQITKTIFDPGVYVFGFDTYDAAGNAHSAGDPASDAVTVSLTPEKPTALNRSSYDSGTEELVLTVSTRTFGERI